MPLPECFVKFLDFHLYVRDREPGEPMEMAHFLLLGGAWHSPWIGRGTVSERRTNPLGVSEESVRDQSTSNACHNSTNQISGTALW